MIKSMKIEIKTKITITLDENEYTLTRSEAQELYNKLKKELEVTDTLPLGITAMRKNKLHGSKD